jgi:hypothetical protein
MLSTSKAVNFGLKNWKRYNPKKKQNKKAEYMYLLSHMSELVVTNQGRAGCVLEIANHSSRCGISIARVYYALLMDI